MNSRRAFFQKGFLGLSGIALANTLPLQVGAAALIKKEKEDTFHLGVAGFSFVNFKLDESLFMMKRMDIKYLCIK